MLTLQERMSVLEITKRLDPNGNAAKIAEILTQQNRILTAIPAFECNRITMHSIKQRTYLPQSEIRRFNKGVGQGATQVKEVLESTMKRGLYSVVDAEEAELSGDVNTLRHNEDTAIIESIGQDSAHDMIYSVKDEQQGTIQGLAPRMASVSLPNVMSHGGTGNRTSLYIVQPGPRKVHLVYPKGSKAGVQHENKSLKNESITWADEDDATKHYEALVSYFRADYGWAVWDNRSIARLGNIDVTDIDNFDENFLIALLNKMPNRGLGARIFCNSDMFTLFDVRAKDKGNVQYSGKDPWGNAQIVFRGNVPIEQVDKVSSNEDALAA